MTAGTVPASRRVTFEIRPDMDPVWTPSAPEFSCAANSVSLMMPTVEPYFIRSARQALAQWDGTTGEKSSLEETVRAYIGQEGQHHRQHVRFNEMLASHYPSTVRLDRMIGRSYRRLERSRSLAFNCAVAAASETMAYSAARWAAAHRRELFATAEPVTATLFLWHLAEEVEHKSVAHDIYWTGFGHQPRARLRYAGAMLCGLALMVSFVVVGTTLMLTAERRLFHPVAWIRLTRWAVLFAFELLTNLTLSLLPGHHPNRFADPLWYEVWLAEFDEATGSMPLWDEDLGHETGLP